MEPYWAALVGVGLGAFIGIIFWHMTHRKTAAAVEEATEERKHKATIEGEKIISQARLSAKEELIKMRDDFEAMTKTERSEVLGREDKIKVREEKLDDRMDEIQKRLDALHERDGQLIADEKQLQNKYRELDVLRQEQVQHLERIGEMTADQAKESLMEELEKDLSRERGNLIRRMSEDVQQSAERKATKLLVQTMQRFAADCTYERTTSTIPLPGDEMKGRIIGREGRNIRVFEAETGVNLLIDDTPSAVVISCFDPIRREVARIALVRLVEDGRIHPTRVEEVVEKARADVLTEIIQAGEDAVHQMQLPDMAPPVVEILGRLQFRYSFTQNVLKHSLEVATFMGTLAGELGLDIQKAKRCGLLHDIGKAMDHEVEGSHAIIGMDFLKRHGEDPEVLNAVGAHHNDIPQKSVYAIMVNICDTLSASRPAARSETTELYLKRLETLEEIGNRFDGVESCYAVQAGRELRILVEPEAVTEELAHDMARNIATAIKGEMQYPGQIKVSVIRESRAIEYAS